MPTIDFLAENQPTELNATALWHLHQFFQGETHENNLAFEKLLREHYLDYSLNSLNRVDRLLDHIRETFHPQANDFLEDDSKRTFLYFLAFYAGELLGRARQSAVIWEEQNNQQSEFIKLFNCRYLCKERQYQDFFPLQMICARLFPTDAQQVEKKEKSLYQAIQKLSPTTLEPTQKLAPSPPHNLGFSGQQALMQTPKKHLAYLQMIPPEWMAGDPLKQQMKDLPTLYEKGRVVWAAVVQANTQLFESDNPYSCPAEVIYDISGRTSPSLLRHIASELFDLKGDTDTGEFESTGNEELDSYAEDLTNEMARSHKRIRSVGHLPLYSTTVFIWRLHLPNAIIDNGVFPILIADNVSTITVLPARYWAHTAFYKDWIDGREPNQEIAPAFATILNRRGSFWRGYKSHLFPKARNLPSLGKSPIDFRTSDDDYSQKFIKHCRLASIEDEQSDYVFWIVVWAILAFVVFLKLS